MNRRYYTTLMIGMVAFYVTGCQQAEQLADDLAASNAATSAEESSKIATPQNGKKMDLNGTLEITRDTLAAHGIKSGQDLYIQSYTVKTSKGKPYDGLTVEKIETGDGYISNLSLGFKDLGIYTLTLDLVNTAGAKASYTYKVYNSIAAPASYQISFDEENVAIITLANLFSAGYVGAKAVTFSESVKVLNSDGKDTVADVMLRDTDKNKIPDALYLKTGGDVSKGSLTVINSDKTETTVNFTVKAVAKLAERAEAKAMEAKALEARAAEMPARK
jgi:hypothetical protein